MKTLQTVHIIFGIAIFFIACHKEEDTSTILTETDILASQGLIQSYEGAKSYNDSLVYCHDTLNQCDQTFIEYCDSLYHMYEDNYQLHHNNYSHSNDFDNHHHQNMSGHRNNGHEHNKTGNYSPGMHTQIQHDEMENLVGNHVIYHPK